VVLLHRRRERGCFLVQGELSSFETTESTNEMGCGDGPGQIQIEFGWLSRRVWRYLGRGGSRAEQRTIKSHVEDSTSISFVKD
jgi:hypothetical protein